MKHLPRLLASAVAALVLAASSSLRAATPQTVIGLKLIGYNQTSATGDFVANTSSVTIQMRFTSSVAGTVGTLNTPIGTRGMPAIDATALGLVQFYPNAATLDAAFPNGNYSILLSGASSGNYDFTFPTLTPVPILITNYTSLQNITGSFATINWDVLPVGVGEDSSVFCEVYTEDNVRIWSVAGLPATARSVTASGLPTDKTLYGVLSYAGVTYRTTAGVVYGISRGASVQFPIVTHSVGNSRLYALSCRAQVGTGGDILIPGVIIGGTGSRQLVVRAGGPAIQNVAGTLARPRLELYKVGVSTPVATNVGWDTGTLSETAALRAAFTATGLPQYADNSADCALIATVNAGEAYTATISGVNSTTGVGLVELYEVGAGTARMTAISCRAQVGTGGGILIPGIIISGTTPKQVIIRAKGPSIVGVAGLLAQPKLTVYDGAGVQLATNTGWTTSPDVAAITAATTACGLIPFPAGSADSAVLLTLPPGGYTAHVSGANGTTGVALVEVYEVP
ncbi:MAG TPA: hypothetical protein VHO24_09955 [Opitutaceae bacterium]|nr:hypothetical protein [Opitutaceae bacterium]